MSTSPPQTSAPIDWSVIGAGPAGIATIFRLIDSGIAGNRIARTSHPYTLVGLLSDICPMDFVKSYQLLTQSTYFRSPH